MNSVRLKHSGVLAMWGAHSLLLDVSSTNDHVDMIMMSRTAALFSLSNYYS